MLRIGIKALSRRIALVMPPNDSDLNSFRKPSWSVCRIPPIGLLSIASYIKSKGHEIGIVDCRELITEYKTSAYIPLLLELLEHFHSDVVGINMLTANFNHVANIANTVKTFSPNSMVILGGVHPSVEPELTFKQIPSVDAICVGAGEEVCLEIAEGHPLEGISGLKVRGSHVYLKRNLELNLDKYPFPDFSIVNKDWYTHFSTSTLVGWGFRGISVLTSRSCPFSCKFCASDWSKPFRYHSTEYVIELVKYLSRLDIDAITFVDDTIGLREDRLVSICEGFIKEKLFYPHTHLRWHAALRANQIKPELLNLMKQAGCFSIGIGIESGSDRMLKVINKKTTVDMNRQACRYVKEAGLDLGCSFMMGIPTETEEDMRTTIRFIKEINCNFMGVGVFRPLPGSQFFNELVKEKENVDWANLGNFSLLPKYKFYNCPDKVFYKLYDEAYNYIVGGQWLSIQNDIAKKYYPLVNEIAGEIKVKVCTSDNYYPDTHIAFREPIGLKLRSMCEKFYVNLPYELRRPIKDIVKRLAKPLSKLLWRYV